MCNTSRVQPFPLKFRWMIVGSKNFKGFAFRKTWVTLSYLFFTLVSHFSVGVWKSNNDFRPVWNYGFCPREVIAPNTHLYTQEHNYEVFNYTSRKKWWRHSHVLASHRLFRNDSFEKNFVCWWSWLLPLLKRSVELVLQILRKRNKNP